MDEMRVIWGRIGWALEGRLYVVYRTEMQTAGDTILKFSPSNLSGMYRLLSKTEYFPFIYVVYVRHCLFER